MVSFENVYHKNKRFFINLVLVIAFVLFGLKGSFSQISYCDTATVDVGLIESVFECNSDSVIINANAGFADYLWSTGDTSFQTVFNYSGLYYLSVTDDSSCIHVDSVLVSIINGNIIQNDTTLCYGDNFILSVSQYSANNKSIDFNGTSYCTLSDDGFPGGSQDRTIEAWIKNEGQTGLNYIFSYGDNSTNSNFSILLDQNDSLRLIVNGSTFTCNQTIPQNIWTHIAVSTDPSFKYVFSIDGVFINSNIITGTFNTSLDGICLLGKSPASSGTAFFNGKIDELRVWNRYIANGEFNIFSHLNPFTDNDLLRFWDFNFSINSSSNDIYGNIADFIGVTQNSDVPFNSYQFGFEWNVPFVSDTLNFIASESNTYMLTLSDGISSCVDSIEITVILPPLFADSLFYCNNDSIILDAGSGYDSYLWNTGSNQQFIDISLSGEYSVETTSGSCIFIDSAFVSVVSVNIIQDNMIACYGDTIILEAISNTGNYYWSTDQITSTIEIIAYSNVSYTVSSSDGFNTCFDNVNIIVIPQIIPGLEDTIVSCNQSLVAAFVPGAFYESYLWSNGDTSQITLIDTPGNYFITVTDQNSCTAIDSTYVNLLNVEIIQQDTVLCSPEQIFLQASTTSNVIWNTGETTSNIIVFPTSSVVYEVTVSDGSFSCSDNVNIDVATPINLSLPDSLLSCEAIVFNLDASGSGGNSYLWSTGATTDNIAVSISNIYSVTVSGDFSCQSVDSTVVSIIDTYITTSDNLVCEGEEVIISTNASGFTYEWSNGSTDAIIFIYPELSSNYHVFVSDGFASCHLYTYIEVINVETGTIFGSQTVYSDSIETYFINQTPGSTYEWFISGGIYTNNIGNEIEVTWGSGLTGYLSVTETTIDGCVGDPVELDITIQFPITINQFDSGVYLKSFPNPAQNILFVVISLKLVGNELLVYDNRGRVVDRFFINDNIIEIPVQKLSSGVYTIKVLEYTSKFIVR